MVKWLTELAPKEVAYKLVPSADTATPSAMASVPVGTVAAHPGWSAMQPVKTGLPAASTLKWLIAPPDAVYRSAPAQEMVTLLAPSSTPMGVVAAHPGWSPVQPVKVRLPAGSIRKALSALVGALAVAYRCVPLGDIARLVTSWSVPLGCTLAAGRCIRRTPGSRSRRSGRR